jgi:hypothetical protein
MLTGEGNANEVEVDESVMRGANQGCRELPVQNVDGIMALIILKHPETAMSSVAASCQAVSGIENTL